MTYDTFWPFPLLSVILKILHILLLIFFLVFLYFQLKSVGPKLVPFFKTVAIYFVLFIPDESPSWFSCLIKCLPVISLCVFVLLHGMSLGQEYCYSRRILTGLVFSCIGDALLLSPKHYFLYGMASFGVAHAMYALAFGYRPWNPYAGTVCMMTASAMYWILLQGLQGLMIPAVFVYVALICIMTWRAIARVQLFEDLWTWTKLCSCAGGIMFCISDTLIGINRFLMPIPYSQVLIMVTYYAAQLGIALSVVDSMATTSPSSKTVRVEDTSSNPLNGAESLARLAVSSTNTSRPCSSGQRLSRPPKIKIN